MAAFILPLTALLEEAFNSGFPLNVGSEVASKDVEQTGQHPNWQSSKQSFSDIHFTSCHIYGPSLSRLYAC